MTLFSWSDPQYPYPHDALAVHASDVHGFLVRAAHVDRPGVPALRPRPAAVSRCRRGPHRDAARARAGGAAPAGPVRLRLDARGHVRRPGLQLPARRRPASAATTPIASDPHGTPRRSPETCSRSRRRSSRSCSRSCSLRSLLARPARAEGVLGGRVPALRGRRGLGRGDRAADGLDARALPRLLPLRRRPDRRVPRRRVGMAEAAAARPRRDARRPRSSRPPRRP